MHQLIGCICEEMKEKSVVGAALTFKCPKHGQVTVDRRQIPVPLYPFHLSTPNSLSGYPNPKTIYSSQAGQNS